MPVVEGGSMVPTKPGTTEPERAEGLLVVRTVFPDL